MHIVISSHECSTDYRQDGVVVSVYIISFKLSTHC